MRQRPQRGPGPGRFQTHVPWDLWRILREPRGKYALPHGWRYDRTRRGVRIEAGQDGTCDQAVFEVPMDIFLSMDAEEFDAWRRSCEIELGRAKG